MRQPVEDDVDAGRVAARREEIEELRVVAFALPRVLPFLLYFNRIVTLHMRLV